MLRQLVAEVGESCNLTALAGAEVMYLDRVETAFPLRMELRPGSRVPLHCSASGKLFLASMTPARRTALVDAAAARAADAADPDRPARPSRPSSCASGSRATASTPRSSSTGLNCVAVPVPLPTGSEVRVALAMQAPAVRMPLKEMLQRVPVLQRAAQAMARTWG